MRRVRLEQVEENEWEFEYPESIVLRNEKLYRGIDLSRYSVCALRNLNGENSTLSS